MSQPRADKQQPHGLLDDAKGGAKASNRRQERPGGKSRGHERDADAGGIGREQRGAAADRGLSPGEQENRGQNRPYARRPTETKCQPHDERPENACRTPERMETRLAHEEAPGESTPSRCSPSTTMTTPAMRDNSVRWSDTRSPIVEALAPSATNTMLNPAVNAMARPAGGP